MAGKRECVGVMPRSAEATRSNISLEAAALAVEAVEGRGMPQWQAGALAGISQPTVSAILAGNKRWGEACQGPVWNALRLEQKRAFQSASFELARKSLIQAEAKLENASYMQAVTGYAILRDKERLDAGEPTEIIGHIQDRRSVESLEALAEALGQALIARNSPID